MKKGGAAKGELVLAIFELANCFRHGWGVQKDAVAAKQYYETAANLGDTDAMNEVAWCYDEGFGTKKDRVSRSSWLLLLRIALVDITGREKYRCILIFTQVPPFSCSLNQILLHSFTSPNTTLPKSCKKLGSNASLPSPRFSLSSHSHLLSPQPINNEADTKPFHKSQYTAAKYYRLAESHGSKTLGNSWYVPFFSSNNITHSQSISPPQPYTQSHYHCPNPHTYPILQVPAYSSHALPSKNQVFEELGGSGTCIIAPLPSHIRFRTP